MPTETPTSTPTPTPTPPAPSPSPTPTPSPTEGWLYAPWGGFKNFQRLWNLNG